MSDAPGDTRSAETASAGARVRHLLRLGDTSLVLAQRLGEWIGHAPAIEEDLGLANLALDLLGQARLLLSYAGELEGRGRDEDQLAFLRDESEFLNLALVEQPNGDFGRTVVRQLLVDAWQLEIYERLQRSTDPRLAEIAARAVKEKRYHLRYSSGWTVRLGDGTAESHARVQAALDRLWPFTDELFAEDGIDRALVAAGIAPAASELRAAWQERIDAVLVEATCDQPASTGFRWFGRRGEHTEHLGHLLAEMQALHRRHPGAAW